MTTAPSSTPTTAATASADAPTLTRIAFDDSAFDGQFLRALDTVYDGGADIGECFITARSIVPGDRDGWHDQWMATGDRVYAVADDCEKAGHPISAREAYLRAVTYYRSAMIFLYRPPMDPRFVAAYRRQRDAFQRAGVLLDWTFEIAQIPYEETALEAYFLTPEGDGPFPVMFLLGGYDGTKEECYFSGGKAALERGYALLLMDGPGQGGALIEHGLHFRPDWEAAVTPAVDWLLARPEVETGRIALMGRSWGGYLAPRAATREHRLAAVIADAAQYTPGTNAAKMVPAEFAEQFAAGDLAALDAALRARMASSPPLAFVFERGMLTHGCASPAEWLRDAGPYTIADGVADINCPVLVCEGENDFRGGDAKPLYDAITSPKEYILFRNAEGAGEHDESGASSLFSQRVYDWLDETFDRT